MTKAFSRLTLCLVAAFPSLTTAETSSVDFRGKAWVSVDDGDMLATAYVDGLRRERESADAL